MIIFAQRGDYELRGFEADDWQALKYARTAMIAEMESVDIATRDPEYSYYKRDMGQPDSFWQEQAAGTKKRHFSLYCNNDVAGITAFEIRPEGEVLFTDTYIFIAHRGKKLSNLLYEGRLRCARGNPSFRMARLFVSHKNVISQKSATRNGFTRDKELNEFGSLVYSLPL